MISRLAGAVLVIFIAASAALAQSRLPEKTGPKPLQPTHPATPSTQPGFVHSPWIKFCGSDTNDAQAKQTCLIVKEARLETSQFVAGAALIEQTGAEKKLLRVTLPLGMQLMPGVRMFIDSESPITRPYVICVTNGCMADFDVNADFVGKLRKGQQLQLQGINAPGQLATYLLPLADFGKAFDGPPTDPVKYDREQRQRA